jgi:hypothetical protein
MAVATKPSVVLLGNGFTLTVRITCDEGPLQPDAVAWIFTDPENPLSKSLLPLVLIIPANALSNSIQSCIIWGCSSVSCCRGSISQLTARFCSWWNRDGWSSDCRRYVYRNSKSSFTPHPLHLFELHSNGLYLPKINCRQSTTAWWSIPFDIRSGTKLETVAPEQNDWLAEPIGAPGRTEHPEKSTGQYGYQLDKSFLTT